MRSLHINLNNWCRLNVDVATLQLNMSIFFKTKQNHDEMCFKPTRNNYLRRVSADPASRYEGGVCSEREPAGRPRGADLLRALRRHRRPQVVGTRAARAVTLMFASFGSHAIGMILGSIQASRYAAKDIDVDATQGMFY